VSWPANAGHPGDAVRFGMDGLVLPGHDTIIWVALLRDALGILV
jgi:hypothetical protein